MRVLVSGAGGFLGRYVVKRLLERGHSVRAIVRPKSNPPDWQGAVDLFPADLRVSGDLSKAFDGVDVALHLAAAVTGNEDLQFASTVVGTERFLQAMARSAVKRLVHVSSFAVYDWSSAAKVMDEKTPLVQNIYEMGGYTIAKVWQERLVTRYCQTNECALTIMRPGFIWGPDNAKIGGMGRKAGPIYLIIGLRTRLPLSHVLNCADCIVLAAETPLDGVNIFNVVDADDVTVWRYVKEYRRRSLNPGLIVPVPYSIGLVLTKLASKTSRMLFGKKGKLPSVLMPRRFEAQFKPIRFSNEKIRNDLGWVQRYTFGQCLDLTYRDGLHPG